MSVLIPVDVGSSGISSSLRVAIEAAAAAGEIVNGYYRQGVEIRCKSEEQPFNLVSNADIESERAVVEFIRRHFPDHDVIGEEGTGGRDDAEHLWIVDPLDGTNNFAHRIPQFAVSIAYYRKGLAHCAVVVNPVRGDWYWAERDRGAFCNNRPMKVSSAAQLSESMVGVGFYYDRGAMMEATLRAIHDIFKAQVHGIRRFGAASLDLCMVADGMLGAFFEYQLSPWDFAAGRLILEEAGGQVTTGLGQPLPLESTSLLASNGRLHSQALRIVAQHHP